MRPVLVALAGAMLGISGAPVMAQMSIPTDMDQTCTTDISGWFDGTPGANVPINAPDSVTFTSDYGGDPDVCDFYIWGAQMFLWLTSAEGDGLVVDGQSFFNVSTDVDGVRTLIPNTDGKPLNFALRSEKIEEVGQAGSSGVLFLSRDRWCSTGCT